MTGLLCATKDCSTAPPAQLPLAPQRHTSYGGRRRAAEREAKGEETAWSNRQLQRWVGISGPYDLEALSLTYHKRGLHPHIFHALMGNRDLTKVASHSCNYLA